MLMSRPQTHESGCRWWSSASASPNSQVIPLCTQAGARASLASSQNEDVEDPGAGAQGVGGEPAQHSAFHPPVLWGTGEALPREGQERMSFSQMIVPLTASYRCGIGSVKNSLHLKTDVVQT